MVQYRLPGRLIGRVLLAAASMRRRSFARDAACATAALRPPISVMGTEHVPPRDPLLVACNHYGRPGFRAWWIALAITASLAPLRAPEAGTDVTWVITAAWSFPGSRWRGRVITPITRFVFARVARVYGFVTMPPMPPSPNETAARAASVLRALRHARQAARGGGLLGLAPEGMDSPAGLGQAPAGAGRFVALLAQAGLSILPVGLYESEGRLVVSFGPPFRPAVPADREACDAAVARQVMDAIGRCLQIDSPPGRPQRPESVRRALSSTAS